MILHQSYICSYWTSEFELGQIQYLEEYGEFNPGSFRSESPCLFKGKNFVFDPRRFDPVVGKSNLGCCLICSKPHDDYDNGHAPNENKEARCCRCRVLILICNHCREKAREVKQELFCGPGGNDCIDEGNKGQYQVVQSQQEQIIDFNILVEYICTSGCNRDMSTMAKTYPCGLSQLTLFSFI